MIRVSKDLSIEFGLHNNRKAILCQKENELIVIYEQTFETMLKLYFKHKADTGQYPVLTRDSQLSNSCAVESLP